MMWERVKAFFGNPTVLAILAHVQVFIGAAWQVSLYYDWSPIVPPAWLPWVILIQGIGLEEIRRRRDRAKENVP